MGTMLYEDKVIGGAVFRCFGWFDAADMMAHYQDRHGLFAWRECMN